MRRATQGNPAQPPGIEGVEMRKVYYNPMRKLTLIVAFLGAPLLNAQRGASQQPASLKTASLESHEGMTITARPWTDRSEEHTSELQSHSDLVCRLLLEKKKKTNIT